VSPPAQVGPWDPCYVREDGWLLHRYDLATGNTLRFAARDMRREKTGVHANVAISVNWVTLSWSNFNIERDEDRVRLANSAYKHLDGSSNALDIAEFPQNAMKHALDLFCYGLWDEVVSDNLGELMEGSEAIGPPKLLLGSYIIDGGGTLVYAAPGRGKSYTAMAMAVALTWGKDQVWSLSDARNCLYINLERSRDSMRWRLARINRALGLPPESPLPFLNARGRSLSDVYEAAARTVEMHSCQVVFLDSISRAGVGDLNENQPVNRVIDMLNRLAPTWLAIAHTPRADETHVYGSVHFEAGEDLGVGLLAQTSADGLVTGIGLRVDKGNDLPRNLPVQIHAMTWDARGLTGIRKSEPGEFPELSLANKVSVEDMAFEYVALVGKATADEIAREVGKDRTTVSRLLNASERFTSSRKGHQIEFEIVQQPGFAGARG
jgi:hypothetical protein